MVQQRRKLGLAYAKDQAAQSDEADVERCGGVESAEPRYHPDHDPALVTDDEIPW